MKTHVFGLLIAFSLLFQAQKLTAQNNEFSKGFQEGFKKGYCYNKNFMCNPPLAPMSPLPRVNESDNNYTDGYNRGFQVGLDMQRVDGSYSSNTNNISFPQYRFNEYVDGLSTKDYVNVLMYKQALLNKRREWLRKRIEDVYDLNYVLLYNVDTDAHNKIKQSIISFFQNQPREAGDLTDDNYFNTDIYFLQAKQKEIYAKYNQTQKEINTVNEYDEMIKQALDLQETDPAKTILLLNKAQAMNLNKDKKSSFNYLKANAYYKLDKCVEAIVETDNYITNIKIENSLDENKTLANTLILQKSYCLFQEQNLKEAITCLDDYFGKEYNGEAASYVYYIKAKCFRAGNDYNNCILFADKFLENNKDVNNLTIDVLQFKASSYREIGKFDLALTSINKAIKQADADQVGSLYATRGLTYFKMKNYAPAADDFVRSLAKDEEDGESCYYLAKSYYYLNQKSKACLYMKKAVKYNSKDAIEELPKICK